MNLLRRAGRALLQKPRRFYPSYQAALAACGDGYEAEELTRVVALKTERFRLACDGLPMRIDGGGMRVVQALAGLGSKINVLDFGGACGLHYFTARRFLGDQTSLKWAVVETPRMVTAAQQLASLGLSFHTSIADAQVSLGAINLVFVSGSLQFPERPRETLTQLIKIPAPRIFFTRIPMEEFSDAADRVYLQISRLQDNGHGPLPIGFKDREMRYPSWILDRGSFVRALGKTHEIVAEVDEGFGYRGFVGNQRPVAAIK